MATLQKKGNGWYCQFLHHGKRHTFTIGRVSKAEARAKSDQVGYLLMRLKQRLIELPPGVDIVEFVQRDGRPNAGRRRQRKTAISRWPSSATATSPRTGNRRREDRSRVSSCISSIWLGALGERFPIRELKLADLQGYVDRRAKAKGMYGRRLSPATIKKEIVTLRTAWNWAVKMGLVAGRFPNDGLRFPKLDEKPPFMTREEIERRIAAGGLTEAQKKELWNALFLTLPEVAELLRPAPVRHAAVGLPDGLLRRPHRCPPI